MMGPGGWKESWFYLRNLSNVATVIEISRNSCKDAPATPHSPPPTSPTHPPTNVCVR